LGENLRYVVGASLPKVQPAVRQILESVLPSNHKVEHFKVEETFPHIGRRTFSLNARRLYQPSKGTHHVLVLLEDLTDERKEVGGGWGELPISLSLRLGL
jgi:hypothetical protein